MKIVDSVKVLRELVSFASISNRPNEDIVEYLKEIFLRLGFDVEQIVSPDEPRRANLLCRLGPDVPGGLMLSGHMDVVPVASQNWHSDPFLLTEMDGRLIGRGSADMKGFIAAVCHVLTTFPLHRLDKPLTLLWTYDEEIGCVGSAQAAPQLGRYLKYLPQYALIGEPTNFSILRMHAGHVTVKVSARGQGAHSSDPDRGISAIKALHHALGGLFALEGELRREVSNECHFTRPFVTMNVGEVHGGTAVNIIPDAAFAMVGFRPLPETSVETVFERIKEACLKGQRDSLAKIEVFIEKQTPAMLTKENSALEKILKPHSLSNDSCAAQFATDGGNLSKMGIECLIFGPGHIDVAHQANEWIGMSDLALAEDKINKVLDSWFLA